MSRVAITLQDATSAGKNVAFTTLGADGIEFANSRYGFVIARNSTVSPIVMTIQTNKLVSGDLVVPDRTITVGAEAIYCVGLFEPDVYNQVDNKVYVDGTDLDVAALAFNR